MVTAQTDVKREALNNVTNTDIAQNGAIDKGTVLTAEMTEAETKIQIAKRVSLCCLI